VVYVFDHRHIGDFHFYNNSIINVASGFVGFESGSASAGCGESMRVQNNLWFKTEYAVNRTAQVTSLTWSHNAYFAMSTGDPDANKQTGSSDPFMNWAAYDFRLRNGTNAGESLSAPYNLDLSGITRGSDGRWDRGAVEFGGAMTAIPQPPSGLIVLPQ
jgi:hypothetical protein